ncbi:hypothetical protein EDB19DRAFT_1673671 [Suillus lakei]|nr:hypothetical protein EDB19DRAFT_1673671 [Suillus lakei]
MLILFLQALVWTLCDETMISSDTLFDSAHVGTRGSTGSRSPAQVCLCDLLSHKFTFTGPEYHLYVIAIDLLHIHVADER